MARCWSATVSSHEFYQRVLYQDVPQPRRVSLHRRLGMFQEAAYADHLPEIAAELSVHFGEGRDYVRAVRYRRLSAENATRLYANREAIEHLDDAVKLLEHVPPEERAELEAAILDERGTAYRTMDDNTAAAADFEKAVECARQAGRTDREVRSLLKQSAVLFLDLTGAQPGGRRTGRGTEQRLVRSVPACAGARLLRQPQDPLVRLDGRRFSKLRGSSRGSPTGAGSRLPGPAHHALLFLPVVLFPGTGSLPLGG